MEVANWPCVLQFDEAGVESVGERKACNFAIVAVNAETGEEEAVGSIGLVMGVDVARRSAELGCWLKQGDWGRGVMGKVVGGFMGWVWEAFPGLVRVHAEIFAWNESSVGFWRENGFVFEGRRRRAVLKDGRVRDLLVHAALRPGWEGEG